ncbi:hydrogenase maturation protease [bacterium (Candidatus Blackallbacteria) CG17_big_fil_post_rev_8_21_14_2_50_48_46]|uniref:Hydrogenase maturation protease n=1 Tax=bacterium (Candidatus Blackallbacteria) CG17_big_fil_post_rev_8_21_14_2_50_48_46 TaxID=2014261 RepID=A0A2M7FYU7_9BACT|nr:MAG: hydrogenase maturation protease [bacterium (Candidatus Blackallbacteria) CG18_big_fil_WC_8_21_14_2_50_49_26]PIW14478.1 MAG: hydrogenase maturation protease [bacterium (Candidatus Blackallbacteria) CG17_big_fil_post_rev_8_21_14_2_50_48_46]PIW47164.1 MAG: hydrogenase maturation protease [bacterium (Candidatus Blackallbacteria) CG13_big_fil_rev_8_21_14_2_50_49_14]
MNRIIGIGHPLRGDDALGPTAIHTLPRQLDAHTECLALSGEASTLWYAFKGMQRVLLIDALQTPLKPGELLEINLRQTPLPKSWLACSTHAFGLSEALELAIALGDLPPTLLLLGIAAQEFETGKGLSAAVEGSLPALLKRVYEIHQNWSLEYA